MAFPIPGISGGAGGITTGDTKSGSKGQFEGGATFGAINFAPPPLNDAQAGMSTGVKIAAIAGVSLLGIVFIKGRK